MRLVGIFEGNGPEIIEQRINNFIKGGFNLISADVKYITTSSNNFWYLATIVYESIEG